jgi:hypothetical protein
MERHLKKYPSKWQNQYTEEFKRHVCDDFLTGTLCRAEIERKYNLGNSRLTSWLKKIGYEIKRTEPLFLAPMEKSSNTHQEQNASTAQLKRELEDAKLLAEAYKRIIDKAEQELQINIRKKYSTK